MPPRPRLVLVHGAATSPAVWDRLLPHLEEYDVCAPERPRTGDPVAEVAWLASVARGAWVVGLSGGATLGLALAATGTPLRGAVLHEPAVGSLLPSLLAPVALAFARSGTAGLARELYGGSWGPEIAGPADDAVTAADLAMFRACEPAPVSAAAGSVVVTTGADSPPVRHEAARLLLPLGYDVREVPAARHFAPYDDAAGFAAVVRAVVGLAESA